MFKSLTSLITNTRLFSLNCLLKSRSCLGQTWESGWRFRTWTRLPWAHPWGTRAPAGCRTCHKSPWAPRRHCSPVAPSPAPWPSCPDKLGSWMRATACGVHTSQSLILEFFSSSSKWIFSIYLENKGYSHLLHTYIPGLKLSRWISSLVHVQKDMILFAVYLFKLTIIDVRNTKWWTRFYFHNSYVSTIHTSFKMCHRLLERCADDNQTNRNEQKYKKSLIKCKAPAQGGCDDFF